MSAAGPPGAHGPGGPEGAVPTCYRHPGRESHIRCQRCARPICPDCMRPAAVGFQCPECVAEGAKQTRQLQGPYGGNRSANPTLTSIVLIGVNVGVWLLILLTGGAGSRWVDRLGLLIGGRCTVDADPASYWPRITGPAQCALARPASTWFDGIDNGAVWQVVTSMFTHVEPWHIGFNMLALWFLGPQLEAIIGRARFLALYFVSGIAGSAAVVWLSGVGSTTYGASGAVFGLIGALLLIAWRLGANYQQILIWLGINAVLTFTISNVSWQGHLGGLLGGFAVAAILVWAPKQGRARVQWGGIAALAVGLLVVIAARIAVLA